MQCSHLYCLSGYKFDSRLESRVMLCHNIVHLKYLYSLASLLACIQVNAMSCLPILQFLVLVTAKKALTLDKKI